MRWFIIEHWNIEHNELASERSSESMEAEKKTSSQTQSVSIQMSKPRMSEKIFNHAFFLRSRVPQLFNFNSITSSSYTL